jgi:hypothetical protein
MDSRATARTGPNQDKWVLGVAMGIVLKCVVCGCDLDVSNEEDIELILAAVQDLRVWSMCDACFEQLANGPPPEKDPTVH